MLNRLQLVVAAATLLCTQQVIVSASPITYDFAGYGSQYFSGSLTIDADPPLGIGKTSITENGSNVSLTVDFGGHEVSFANNPQNPYAGVTFSAFDVPTQLEDPPGKPTYEVLVYAGSSTSTFAMTFYSPGWVEQLSSLRDLRFPSGTASAELNGVEGKITSIEEVSAPEPSTLAIFAVLGIAAMAHRRCRRSWTIASYLR